jgi:phenolic acid decarboxylase
MLDSEIYPTYLCIEFDLMLKGKDLGEETVKTISKLKKVGYKELINDNLNITYFYQGK